jgi:predicted Zn-dependent protease
MGIVYAAMSDPGPEQRTRTTAPDKSEEYAAKAIQYLEKAIDKPIGDPDPNVRATLSRLYLRTSEYDKAVKMLTDLVNQEPGWQDGPMLLAEAYAGAGRTAEGITWLEGRAADDPRLLATPGRLLRAGAALERCRRRVLEDRAAGAAQSGRQNALRPDAPECRRPQQHRQGA